MKGRNEVASRGVSQIGPSVSLRGPCFVAVLVSLLLAACSGEEKTGLRPSLEEAAIDASDWDFVDGGPLTLSGEWLFRWGQLIEAAPWAQLQVQLKHRVRVPAGCRYR